MKFCYSLALSIGVFVCLAFGFSTLSFGQSGVLSEVYKGFTMAANAAEYSKAESYLCEDSLRVVRSQGRFSKFCDQISKNGTITKIDVIDESTRGERGVLKAKVFYKDSSSVNDEQRFRKEYGTWKIEL